MDLGLTAEQDTLRDTVTRFLAKSSPPDRVRAAEPLGFDAGTWRGLLDIGALDMAAPDGSSLVDLGVVAEAVGAAIAPVPLVEAVVATRTLGTLGTLGALMASGEPALVTFCPRPAVDGVARLAPAGAIADAVVALDDDELVVAAAAPSGDAPANLAAAPLADRALRGPGVSRSVLASGHDAHERFGLALDQWRALSAVALAGLARAALDLGVAYVKERRQFGVTIGSFQSVQHRLADVHTAVDGARLLAYEACWAIDEGDTREAALATMAFAFCSETAEEAAAAGLHYHGGYGFMLEYDIQLFVRRARAWRLALGDPQRELLVLADRLWGA